MITNRLIPLILTSDVGLMVCQRRRRWPTNKPRLDDNISSDRIQKGSNYCGRGGGVHIDRSDVDIVLTLDHYPGRWLNIKASRVWSPVRWDQDAPDRESGMREGGWPECITRWRGDVETEDGRVHPQGVYPGSSLPQWSTPGSGISGRTLWVRDIFRLSARSADR